MPSTKADKATKTKATKAPAPAATTDHEPIAVSPLQVQVLPVALADVVRDPELQSRAAGIDKDTVKDYAAAMERGEELPAIEIIRDENGRLLLTDGWHRMAAAEAAKRDTLLARIVPGTRADAVLAAAGANSKHGKQRTHEDKRRSVRMILGIPEHAKLTGRKLGEKAGVSHTYVDEVRKKYGLAVGDVLTASIRQAVDGEPTPEWVALAATEGLESWRRSQIENIRKARTLKELAERLPNIGADASPVVMQAVALRLAEMRGAHTPWPWGDDPADVAGNRRRIAAGLDHVLDVEAALLATGGTMSDAADVELLVILVDVGVLASDYGYSSFDKLETRWRGRQALLDALTDARKRRDEAVAADPAAQASLIGALIKDPAAQAEAFENASDETRARCHPRMLAPAVRDLNYRGFVGEYLAAKGSAPTRDCPNPACGGWAMPVDGRGEVCVVCDRTPEVALTLGRLALNQAARLIMVESVGLAVTPEVTVDAATVALLALLRAEMEAGGAWLAKVPAEVRNGFRAWHGRAAPTLLGTGYVEPAFGLEAALVDQPPEADHGDGHDDDDDGDHGDHDGDDGDDGDDGGEE